MTTCILLAEDDPIQRLELKQMLLEQGYLVVGEVADGARAVDLAGELTPDLVLMDIRLPGQDGISAAARLREQQLAPVILLSALSSSWFVARARDAGALQYLVKPVQEYQLRPAIEIALARARDRQIQEERARLLQEALDEKKRAERERGQAQERLELEKFRRTWEEGE